MTAPTTSQATMAPPPTRREDIRETLGGVEVADPYRWLEDRGSPETQAWIEEQEAHCRRALDGLPGRAALGTRLESFLRVEAVGVPIQRGQRFFTMKRRPEQEQWVLHVREGLRGRDEVLIDPNTLSTDHSTSLSFLDASADGSILAYGLRRGGADELTVRLFDVAARKDLPDAILSGRVDAALLPNGRGVYLTRFTNGVGPRVTYHEIGTDSARDVPVFGDGIGPDRGIGVGISDDGRWLLLVVWYGSAGDKTDVYVADLRHGGAISTIVDDVPARFQAELAGGRIFVRTDWQAPRGRILEIDPEHPRRELWREVVPQGPGIIEELNPVFGMLAVRTMQDVQSTVRLYRPDGTLVRDIPAPGVGALSGLTGRWDSKDAFFTFSSFATPQVMTHVDLATGRQSTWHATKIPFRGRDHVVEQVWYASKDGTKIPMFLAHRKDMKRDGTNPTLMTGYGGFNISELPWFSSLVAAWMERGGLFAMPNLRGGGEFGEEWHRAGMFEKKQNVFDDFIAAAEYLTAEKWTSPAKLAISGRSNGGLLVGAAMTQRPDLFSAVVCGYPLLDMLRYQNFLVAKFWVSEYGSSDDPSQVPYLLAYSPYHNVKDGVAYPAVLFETGDSDTRVDPLHARKMAARMQAATSGERPVLLHYDTKAGHSGGEPVTKQVEDIVDTLSFLGWQLGLDMAPEAAPTRSRWR